MKGSSFTTSIKGSRSTNERTVVDFPVPRSPITMMPPMFGSIMFMIAANFISYANDGAERVYWTSSSILLCFIFSSCDESKMRANNSYCVLTFRFANLGSLPSATAFDTTVRFALVLDLRRTLLKKKLDRWCWLQKCSRALITCSRRKLLLRVIHLKELGDMWKRFESRE